MPCICQENSSMSNWRNDNNLKNPSNIKFLAMDRLQTRWISYSYWGYEPKGSKKWLLSWETKRDFRGYKNKDMSLMSVNVLWTLVLHSNLSQFLSLMMKELKPQILPLLSSFHIICPYWVNGGFEAHHNFFCLYQVSDTE